MSWEIDSVHSQAMFSVRHMMVATVKGHFDVLNGKLEIDEQHPERSWIEAEADAASIDTRDEKRDAHLRSPEFFDVDKYPRITFKSTKIESIGNHEYRIAGKFTMRDVTKEVTFRAEYSGQVKDAFGLQRAGLNVKGKINRKDFGLTWNAVLEAGGLAVGEEVTIEIDLSIVQKAPVPTA